MKVYIAGKITGNDHYREEFAAAEEKLRALGYIPINPAADVAPVRHGRWEKYVDNDDVWGELEFEKCSLSGAIHYNTYNYCPNCGAKMNGGNS